MSKYRLSQNSLSGLPTAYPNASTYLDFIQNRRGRRAIPTHTKPLFETADEKMMRIKDIIWQVADTNVPILITGESGVGKEVIARAVHDASSNSEERPFIAVNCAAMPPTLLESELFGFEKGSFTGANQQHQGKFEQANNGTILLDEVTEIDPNLQAKLLRVLQEKEIDRIGGKSPIPLKTRVIATTNKDIVEAVNQGKFRQDLYYRLYVLHLDIPPLRSRQKDILFLAKKFLNEYARAVGREDPVFTESAITKLTEHNWPGNVRELQNVIQRAVLLTNDSHIDAEHLPIEENAAPAVQDWVATLPIGQALKSVETHFILETLKHHRGNRTHAARTLGISLRTLRNKINEYTRTGFEVTAPYNGKAI